VAILLHCSASHSGQWVPLIEQLAPNFTVLAPDLYGYGRSDPMPDDGQPFLFHNRALVGALVAEYGGPVHLVGHSMGGTVSLRYTLDSPKMVASLCVIEPVQFSLLEETGAPEQAEFHFISEATSAPVHQDKMVEAARLFVDFWVVDGAFDAMDAKTQNYIAQMIGALPREWSGMGLDARGQLRVADIAKISQPCLIMRGGATRASARAITEILHQNITGSTLHEIAGTGHMGPANHPGPYNVTIGQFLRDQIS
jgi:pimeloyl-ACP methyl ester carboxylesterase